MDNPKGRFLRVVCKRCGNNSVVFGKSSIKVKCDKCNKLLLKTNGGKIKIKTLIREVL